MPEILLPNGLSAVVSQMDKRRRKPIDYEASIQALQTLRSAKRNRINAERV